MWGQQVDGVWQYQHTDALGSVRHLSDASGQLLATMDYTPFGVRTSVSGSAAVLGFTGEPSDPSGDLLYLRARFYHPALGRFLTPDSLIPDPTNGQAWNRYAYVYNDPQNWVDPSGHHPIIIGLGVVGAIYGAAWAAYGIANEAAKYNTAWDGWWNNTPTCGCTDTGLPMSLSLGAGVFGGALLGFATTPANATGEMKLQTRRTIPAYFDPDLAVEDEGAFHPTTQAGETIPRPRQIVAKPPNCSSPFTSAADNIQHSNFSCWRYLGPRRWSRRWRIIGCRHSTLERCGPLP
ncbi:MAG: RHS repeat-associated core domain-containing protein [Methylacidiphilales bacterium]|nr:RHS repeat-associated core domain-containing protein [Candidatus Methylacidiphilales bacterium]